MDSLICEAGPKNPLLFLSLSLVNRIPGYNPDEKETLNQLECMNDLINSVSSSLFRLDTVLGSSAVAIDALITISSVEAKKSLSVRVSALECLKLLLNKMSACGIGSLIEFIPGILSKIGKLCSNRVDIEIERVLQLSLQIIELIVKSFWDGQDEWKRATSSSMDEESFIILRQKYRTNIEMIICSLRPLIRCQERIEIFREIILNIYLIHLKGNQDQVSTPFLKMFLLLTWKCEIRPAPIINVKFFLQFHQTEILEWFQVNFNSLSTIHEEILTEKVEIICGLINLKNSESFLLISDLFAVLKRLMQLKKITLDFGEVVSINYSTSGSYGIQHALFKNDSNDKHDNHDDVNVEIEFKTELKLSKELKQIIEILFSKLIQFDPESVQLLISKIEDDSIEGIIQKINMTSFFYSQRRADSTCIELFKECLKYHENFINDWNEAVQLITLKLLCKIECIYWDNFDFRPCLMVILSGMSSDWIILKEASTETLKGLCKKLNLTIKQFLAKHEIFLLDRLGLQLSLPSLYPKAPKIISCIIRDILEPTVSLKFTDLLVKKVSENLAIYQRNSVYCKDLIDVIYETVLIVSKNEKGIPFIEPKDILSKSNESDETLNTRDSHKPVYQQQIIIDLLKIGINFILSDSKLIRSKSIDLIQISTINYLKYENNTQPSDLCQLIHLAWPNMISVLKDSTSKTDSSTCQLDCLVIESFAGCCKILYKHLPLFMRDRFVKDYWKLFLNNNRIVRSKGFLNSSLTKISNLLFEILNFGLIYCKPSTEICLQILDFIKEINDPRCLDVLKILWELEPDIIWYFYSIELGELKEILAPSGGCELKSFYIYNKTTTVSETVHPLIKEQLKQFIK